MDVAVDHCGFGNPPFMHQHPRCNRNVIEDAVAFAAIRKGVMRASSEVRRDARSLPHNRASGRDRGANRTSRALDHGRGPRESDAALGACGQASSGDGLHVLGRVCSTQIVPGCRCGNREVVGTQHPIVQQPRAKPFVLGHGEAMPIRQRKDERIGVEGLHDDRLR